MTPSIIHEVYNEDVSIDIVEPEAGSLDNGRMNWEQIKNELHSFNQFWLFKQSLFTQMTEIVKDGFFKQILRWKFIHRSFFSCLKNPKQTHSLIILWKEQTRDHSWHSLKNRPQDTRLKLPIFSARVWAIVLPL